MADYFSPTIEIFYKWEETSRDTVDFKKIYVDIADDLIAGLLLSQIIYWHLPSNSGKSKLRVQKEGKTWLAKSRTDWWDEVRITPKQFDRASRLLKEKNIIETKLFKFNGIPTVHIYLNEERFLELWEEKMGQKDRGQLPPD
jgi:hypothetical protein